MSKNAPATYKVTVTAVRNYVPGTGAPSKSQLWNFVQTVNAVGGCPGALAAIGKLFFHDYKKPNGEGVEGDFALILPDGKHGQLVITRDDSARLHSYLSGKPPTPGDVSLQSDDAVLHIKKLSAMSGDAPTRLTPASDKELSDRIHHNNESIEWWQDPMVQMPTPIYVLDNLVGAEAGAPSTVRYRGSLYRRAEAVSIDQLSSDDVKPLFYLEMDGVSSKLAEVNAMLKDSGITLQDGKCSATETLASASKSILHQLIPSLLTAFDLAKRWEDLKDSDD